MSGEDYSSTDKAEEFMEQIAAYGEMLALPTPENRSVQHYINMVQSDLRRLDADEASYIAFELSAYAYFLGDEIDRQRLKMNVYEQAVSLLIDHRGDGFSNWDWKNHRAAFILKNPKARDYQKKAFRAKQAMESLKYKQQNVIDIANRMTNIHFRKRQTHD